MVAGQSKVDCRFRRSHANNERVVRDFSVRTARVFIVFQVRSWWVLVAC
jgi:hypothetical protein